MKIGSSPTAIVANTALDLLEDGNNSPKIGQLLKPLNGNCPTSSRGIRELIANVRRKIENDSQGETLVCTVSEIFYTGYKEPSSNGRVKRRPPFTKVPPESDYEAKLCLPGGRLLGSAGGNRIAGLYFPESGRHDRIYMMFEVVQARQTALHHGLVVNRCYAGITRRSLKSNSMERIAEESAQGLFQKITSQMDGMLKHFQNISGRIEYLENKSRE